MTELIASGSLGAFDAQNIKLMGMPNIGAEYTSHTSKNAQHRLDDNAVCCCCGQRAKNGHHLVPKGMGGGRRVYVRQTDIGCFHLFSPIFAVCGMGNSSGCHGKFHHHGGFFDAKWVWDSDVAEEEWDLGTIWRRFPSNGQSLYQVGHWEITDGEKTWEAM